jgi:hypothetical protein
VRVSVISEPGREDRRPRNNQDSWKLSELQTSTTTIA